jgi:hypothetical protein
VSGLLVHALHYGLLVAGLVTLAALAWTVHRGRREHPPGDGHDERVRRLRAAIGDGMPADVDPGGDAPPSG